MVTRRTLILPLLIAALGVGCQSSDKPEPPPPVRLAIDPDDPPEIVGWWSNDEQLVRLDDSGLIEVLPGQDPHAWPSRRGLWLRGTYAQIWVEYYDAPRYERLHVPLKWTGGDVALELPDMAPFFRIDGPAEVLTDRLFGQWRGRDRGLQLSRDMRYRLSPPKAADPDSPAQVGHQGRWAVDGEQVLLVPDAPGIAPARLFVVYHQDDVTMQLDDEQFRRADPRADDDDVVPAPAAEPQG